MKGAFPHIIHDPAPLAPGVVDTTVRQIAIAAIIGALGPGGAEHALQCGRAIVQQLRARGVALRDARIMIGYGGGKDSSYLLLFMRAVQLVLRLEFGGTFTLIVATHVQGGMRAGVMTNIRSCFDRLGLHGDPDVELATVSDGRVVEFDPDQPVPPGVRQANRESILLAGHRTQGQARPTFCNECNFGMVDTMHRVARARRADMVVTGDSPREQSQYLRWTVATSRKFGLARPEPTLTGVFISIASIKRHLANPESPAAMPALIGDGHEPLYFAAFDFTPYQAGAHRAALRFLEFTFGEDFAGTESDCANPILMAHLRGLLVERVRGGSYNEGVDQYLQLWRTLMASKRIPADLTAEFMARYAGPAQRAARRAEAEHFAADVYGLDDAALVAMLFSPFASAGHNLDDWLEREQPRLAPRHAAIRDALSRGVDAAEIDELSHITCLSPAQMRVLWRDTLVTPAYRHAHESGFHRDSGSSTPTAVLLERDPHQVEIAARLAASGPVVIEMVSGR